MSIQVSITRESTRLMHTASLWKRVAAFGVDMLILVGLYSTLIDIINNVLRLPVKNSPILERGLSLVIDPYVEEHLLELILLYSSSKLIVIFPYFALMESSRRQGTIGKMLLGIRVVDRDGQRLSLSRACARTAGKLLSGILLIGYVVALFTKQRRALHDLLADTLVVNS